MIDLGKVSTETRGEVEGDIPDQQSARFDT